MGVIAVTSTLTFACTTSAPEDPGPASSEPAKPGDPAAANWRSRLALAKPVLGAKSNLHGGHTSTLGAPGAPSGACGLATGDPTCDACLDTSCCAQNTACVSDADCNALLACGDACRDDACFSACYSAHPTGAALLDALSSCADTSCSAKCGGPPSSPPSTSACGFGSGDATCDSCLDSNCCGDANACLGDADCTALLDCAYACTDAACESACEAAHPTGAAKLDTLSTCASTACGAACGGPPPSGGSCGLTSGDATCDACLDGSCCAETTTCVGDADCVALLRCYDGCSDATCAAACDAAHPGGSAKLDTVATCVQTSCTTACGL
jgi:hypothetical protein